MGVAKIAIGLAAFTQVKIINTVMIKRIQVMLLTAREYGYAEYFDNICFAIYGAKTAKT